MTLDPNVTNALGVILVALLTLGGTLINWIAYLLIVKLRAKIGVDQWNVAQAFLAEAVKWAERYGVLGVIENTGKVKKEAVVEAAQAFFDQHGIKISAEQLDILIEATLQRGSQDPYPSLIAGTVGATTIITTSNTTPTTTTN